MHSMAEEDGKPFRGVQYVVRGIIPEGHTVTPDGSIVPAPATARDVRQAVQQGVAEVRQDVQQLRSELSSAKTAPEPSPTHVIVGDGVPSPAMLDVKGCAALLGISVRSWQRLVEHGEAPKPVKIGKSSRWLRSDVEAFVASRR